MKHMETAQAKRLIILHCFGRTSQERWYQSVASEVGTLFDEVLTPDLPHPDLGLMSEWLPTLQGLQPDQHTVLIGHSLSGTLILRYLEEAAGPIAGFYTVAAPTTGLDRDELEATGFFADPYDWATIKRNAMHRVVLASTDDDTVPFGQAEEIAAQTGAELIAFANKGHFRDDTFPELVARLAKDWKQ